MKDHLRDNFLSWYAKEVTKQLKTLSVKEVNEGGYEPCSSKNSQCQLDHGSLKENVYI